MKFFFDEGLGQNLSQALKLVGKDCEHVKDVYPGGAKDVVWLEYVGEQKLALITKDKNLWKKPNEIALLRKYKIVVFYLGGSETSGHDILKQLANAWSNMERKAEQQLKKGVAGAFYVSPAGGQVDQKF